MPPVANPQSIIALVSILCAPVLSACESDEVGKLMAEIKGTRAQYDAQQKAYADLAAKMQEKDALTDAELEALRQSYAALALNVAPSTPEPIPAPPEPTVGPTEPPFECVSIFRVQTCEDGVLYQLDGNMNWILPGRTK